MSTTTQPPTFGHNTFHQNRVDNPTREGGGIYSTNANANIDSNIIDNNEGTGIHAPGGTAQFNNIIPSLVGEDYGGGIVPTNGMSESPDYVSSPSKDFHLLSGSPGEDQANPALSVNIPADFDGDIRPTNGGPDIGADEINSCLIRVINPLTSEPNYFGVLQDAIDFAEDFEASGDLPDVEIARGECRGVVDAEGTTTQQVGFVSTDLHFIGSLVRATFADQNDFGNIEIGNYTSILNAEGNGRVIYITGTANPTFEQLIFVRGDATQGGGNGNGGAIYNSNGIPTNGFELSGGHICESDATNGAGYYGVTNSIADITGVRIGYCSAAQVRENESGGVESVSYLFFFANDATGQGGGLWTDGRFDLRNVSFYSNTAGTNGGGMFNSGDDNRIINGTFYRNLSGSDGGGVYNSGDLALYHNTYRNNRTSANSGAAIYNTGGATLILNSSIVYSNTAAAVTGAALHNAGGGTNIDYNNFYDNVPSDSNTGVGGNVILQDPLLTSGNLLRTDSPVIDKADETILDPGAPGSFPFGQIPVDYDRHLDLRPDGTVHDGIPRRSDMGSDEYIKDFGCAIEFHPEFQNTVDSQANGGDTVVYTFDLINTGHEYPYNPLYYHGYTDTITLTLQSSSQGWAILDGGDTQTFTLEWKERVQGTLTVTVPDGAVNGTQEISTLLCQSTARPDRTRTGQARTNVGLTAGLAVEPVVVDSAQPGDVLTFTHEVINLGNDIVRASIASNAGPEHASADIVNADGEVLTNTIVTLAPVGTAGSSVEVLLRVTILDTAASGDTANPGVVATEVDNDDNPVSPLNQGSVINTIDILPAPGPRYVATSNSSDNTNCTDPAQPCATIQYAIDQAVDHDTVFISSGNYTNTVTQTIGVDVYTQNIYVDKSVTLRGGYNVADGFTSYEPITNATYLNGRGNNRVVFITDSITVTMNSLFIQNGLASPADPAGSIGGAIYNAGANLTVTGTWVLDNRAQFAAGLYHEAGELFVNSSVFANNTNETSPLADGEGAGIYVVTGDCVY